MDYEKAYKEALERAKRLRDSKFQTMNAKRVVEEIFPELRESEDERIRKAIIHYILYETNGTISEATEHTWVKWLEKQKENPKTADSIPSDCASDAKCEDRWHKVGDSLPDNGRLVLANDCLGNTLLARYDGEGNWEVSVYDNDDYYCRNTITKWCDIPSEKQKEQKPTIAGNDFGWIDELKHDLEHPEELDQKVDDVLKQRKGIRALEWSKEDEHRRNDAIYFLESAMRHYADTSEIEKTIAWLKSLRPSWKPSEEQMSALNYFIKLWGNSDDQLEYTKIFNTVKSLRDDLEKLM